MKRGTIYQDNSIYILLTGLFIFFILLFFLFLINISKNVFMFSPPEGYGYGDEKCNLEGIGFAEDTKIFMSDESYKVIQNIQVEDKVMGYDFTNEQNTPKTVQDIIMCIENNLIKITFSQGNNIITTDGLFIYTDKGWKRSGLSGEPLAIGNKINTGNLVKEVTDIQFLQEPLPVYRLIVDEDRYFIDDPIMVMNSPCEPSCTGLECGEDGCGGICGECNTDKNCVLGLCELNETDEKSIIQKKCIPKCMGKTCGDNGCGGVCGNCGYKEECANGKCIIKEEPKVVQNTFPKEEKTVQLTEEKTDWIKISLIAGAIFLILILSSIVAWLIYMILKPPKKKKKK